MIAKRTTRGIRQPAKGLDSSKSGVGESDAVFVVDPIGMRGEPTLEEYYALRESMFDELQNYPIPGNLVDAVRNFPPHVSVSWFNDEGAAANPEALPVEPGVGERSPSELEGPTEQSLPKTVSKLLCTLPRILGLFYRSPFGL